MMVLGLKRKKLVFKYSQAMSGTKLENTAYSKEAT